MIKYIIVDDEHIAHEIIKGYCDLLPNMKFMTNCYDAIEAIDYLNQHTVDLIFLDLNMPKLKGFDFLKTLSQPPKVIVTTAYSEHALEGYELNVVDYLLKPISFERFVKAINKITNPSKEGLSNTSINTVSEEQRIFLRSNKAYIQVNVNDILYIEASGNYTKVITTLNTITVREKLSDIIELLASNQIIQVHKSYAVAIKYIDQIEGNRIRIQDHTIPIGKMYKSNINALLR